MTKLRQIIYKIKIFHKKRSSQPDFKSFLQKNKYNPIFFGRARTGLIYAIKQSIKIRKKKCILMSPYTIMDLINCAHFAGAKIVFYDLNNDLKKFYPDLSFFEKELSKKIYSSLIITHYHLNYKFVEKLRNLCDQFNVDLIEDCAIAYGSKYHNNQPVGTLSDYALFSNSLFKFSNYLWGGFLHVKNINNYKDINKEIRNFKTLSFFDYMPQIFKYLKFSLITNKIVFNFFVSVILKFYFFFNFKFIEKILKNDPFLPFNTKPTNSYFTRPHDFYFSEMVKKKNYVNKSLNHRNKIFKSYNKYLSTISINFSYNSSNIKGAFINFPILLSSNTERVKIKKILLLRGYDIATQQYRNCAKIDGYPSAKEGVKNLNIFIDRVLFLPTHNKISYEDSVNISKIIIKNISPK